MLVSLAVAALAALAPRPVVADHQWDLEHAHARFDYRRSFKQPFFLRDDSLPYFKATESVVHGPDFQRLAMGVPFHRGSIWATKPNAYPEWKVEMKFRISGRGPIGGDGFVLWYTHSSEPQGELDYYGHSSRFRGLAVVFDTSDVPDARYHPFIFLLRNDGSKHAPDFSNYMSPKVQLGGCYREYRNTPHPMNARLSYLNKTLALDIDMQHFGNAYTNCFTVYMPDLPHNYFFGLSASTDHSGTDDHDIESFELYEYNPPPREHKMRPNEEEDIAKGRKFHMDDTLRAEIKHAEEDVRHLREAEAEAEGDHEEEGVNSQSVQKLEENQFKIIEALNLIEQKLEIVATARRASAVVNEVLTPAHQNEFENRLVGQFGILQTEIDDIRDHARVLHRQVDELKDLTHRLLTAIDGKLGQTKRVVEETRANIASSSAAAGASRGQEHIGVVYYALYLFAALAGVALIIAAWSYHIRARERQLKKFI